MEKNLEKNLNTEESVVENKEVERARYEMNRSKACSELTPLFGPLSKQLLDEAIAEGLARWRDKETQKNIDNPAFNEVASRVAYWANKINNDRQMEVVIEEAKKQLWAH